MLKGTFVASEATKVPFGTQDALNVPFSRVQAAAIETASVTKTRVSLGWMPLPPWP